VWQHPALPALLTLAFVLACALPLVLARLPLVSAVRHYELSRRERLRVLLHALEVETNREVHAALGRFPSYEGAPPGALRESRIAGAEGDAS
jgi:hypothetical protein